MIAYAEQAARKGNLVLPMPAALEHVWNGFCAVTATRGNNGFGLLPISFAEIGAWASLTASQPTPWEVALIRRIDVAVLPILNAKKGMDEPDVEVDANDEVGVKGIFASLKARSQAAFGKPANTQ